MRLNTEWLRELVEIPEGSKDLGQRLTDLGLEVEALVELRQALPPVVIGEVLSIEPIDGSDEFHICRVDLGGGETRQIVCGSEHPIEPGYRVPVAPAGTTLPTGIEIQQGRFRGVVSEGMICLDREMGILPQGDGLQVFGSETDAGSRLVDVAEIPDALITVSVLPNRPDCLGLVGIARELAAAYGVPLVEPSLDIPEAQSVAGTGVEVGIEDVSGCPRYTARAFEGLTVRKSPLWLSSRVAIAGFRPINNVVDITNLVQYEYGQPLHAFDRDRLHDSSIGVRSASEGETVTVFGGQRIDLTPEDLVITSGGVPVGLAGIMGSEDSGVTSKTHDVVLEAAYFDPVRIRKASRRLQLRTEASKRFERGVDPNAGVDKAGRRAAALFLALAGGTYRRDFVDVYPEPIRPRSFDVPPELVERTLGFPVEGETIVDTLERLGMEHEGDYRFAVPTWRADATEAVVLVEDVFRHYGYARSPRRRPGGWVAERARPRSAHVRREIQELLLDEGFWETRTLSLDQRERLATFTGDSPFLDLENPATSEMTTLRSSLFPRLLDAVVYNHRRHREPLRFFEIDNVFDERGGDGGRWVVSVVAKGPSLDSFRRGAPPPLDFFVLKGIVQRIFSRLGLSGVTVEWAPVQLPWLDPAEAARIEAGGRDIGPIGKLEPKLARRWELPGDVYLAELDVEAISALQAAQPRRRYSPLPRFPSVDRDLSLLVPLGGADAATLEQTIHRVAGELVESVRCYDVYEGPGIDDGHRSVTFLVRYRRADRTLTASEVSELEERVIDALASDHEARVRGRVEEPVETGA